MANQFDFSMSEDFLRAYADYLKQLREQNPGKTYRVTLSVDLIPDGIGYEVREPPQITIDEDNPEDPSLHLDRNVPFQPITFGEEEREPPDLVAEQMRRIESPGYNQLGEDEPFYVPSEEDEY